MKNSFYFGLSFVVLIPFTLILLLSENMKTIHHFDWSGIRENVKDSVIKIDKAEWLGGYINQSKQYYRIKWFKENVNDLEAYKLANYPGTPIKALMFHHFLSKRDPMAIEILKKNISDTSYVFIDSGCLINSEKLNEYLLSRFSYKGKVFEEYKGLISQHLLDSIQNQTN